MITCPTCGMTSHNPNDIREGYCGNCHAWTRPDPTAGEIDNWLDGIEPNPSDAFIPPLDWDGTVADLKRRTAT